MLYIYIFIVNFSAWTISQFEKTPRMSTYLFALAISDFPFKETKYKHYKVRSFMFG